MEISTKEEELRNKIARAAGFSRSNGWYFDKEGEKLNATHKVAALETLFKQYAIQERANELAGILSRNIGNGNAIKTNANMTRVMTINERYIELTSLKENHGAK